MTALSGRPANRPTLEEEDRLEAAWGTPHGVSGWFSTVDHKRIARRYLVTAVAFLLLGGLEAGIMRLQLGSPEAGVVSAQAYNQLFTMHGTTMMFLFAVPVMTAMGLYLVPLMVGARNLAFPRLNAVGYWVYLLGGLLLYSGLIAGQWPDTGWFAYAPLSEVLYDPGKRADVWAQTVTFTEISALITAVEIIVTVFKLRAPGMALARIPLFVWAQLVTAVMIVFAMPAVATGSIFLALDRLVSTRIFTPPQGGDALLWQHLFWFFGHPEVYIIFLPGMGIVSAIVATFTGREVFGYPVMVAALVTTGILSFGLWVHHMFATPIPQMGAAFFTAASIAIAIPSGVQIFCWLATFWLGRPRFSVPLLFVLGFIVLFVMGGVTGVMVASVPFDLQAHDSFFVVAHLHYVLLGGAVFPLFGGFYYWFPKFTGRMLDERLGRWQFWLFFGGMHLTFFPMHLLGLHGMPRRVYTYLAATGWGDLNRLATAGAGVIVVSMLLFLFNVARALRRAPDAPADPWRGETLEWSTPSPPPNYNFGLTPVVHSRAPMWESGEGPGWVDGLDLETREVLVTTVVDAEPDHRHEMPGPSLWPMLMAAAAGVTFIWGIFTPWALPAGVAIAVVAMLGWAWPRGNARDQLPPEYQP